MIRWKIPRYIMAVLFSLLIITFSFTFRGIISQYSNTYYNLSKTDLPVKKQVMGTDYIYTLPSNWSYDEKSFEGGEILYHADFVSEDKAIRGFAEVWKANMPLSEFLEESKKSSLGESSFKYYKIQNTKIGIYNGFILEYSIRGNNGKYYKAVEYFIPSKDYIFFRISFFVPEDSYNNKIDMIIKRIIDTIHVKNHIT